MTDSANLIGAALPRSEGAAKVTGSVDYAFDKRPANAAHAALVLSPRGPGRIEQIDLTAAMGMPGVVLACSHVERRPKLNRLTLELEQTYGRRPHENFVPLQGPDIHYPGQIVAMVVADSEIAARTAAAAVLVDVRLAHGVGVAESGSELDWASALGAAVHVKTLKGVPTDQLIGKPDPSRAVTHRLEQIYTTPMHFHSALERHGRIAWWEGDRLFVREATQWVRGTARALGQVLGISDDDVRVINPFVGGGFGGKAYFRYDCALAAWASRELDRPVVLELTRAQTFPLGGGRPATRQRIALAADADGRLLSIEHDTWSSGSRVDPGYQETCGYQTRQLYATPLLSTTHRILPFDLPTTCPMRGPGAAPGSFAIESAMNDLAYRLGMDPLALRLLNHSDAEPVTGRPFSAKHLRDCYAIGAERIGWSDRPAVPGRWREGEWRIGYGMATASYDVVQYRTEAEVELRPDSTAEVRLAAHDLGTGTYTILAQVAADVLGLPIAQVVCRLGDSTLPPASVAAGQAQANSAAPAVVMAARDALALRQSCANKIVVGRGVFQPEPQDGPWSLQSWGAQFVMVAVSSVTCEIRVRRAVGVFDFGRVLNAMTARSQLQGGIIFGLVMALSEAGDFDQRGFQANASLGEYLVPVHADVPRIDVVMLDRPDEIACPILGAKGCGEIGTVGVAAALASAVHNATGIHIRDLPITLDKLLVRTASSRVRSH